jgi:hypothetical protein
MANIQFYRGGDPKVRFMWNESDVPEYGTVFTNTNIKDTPPYDAHVDGAYNLGNFVLGMPINPRNVGMTWQAKSLKDAKVGDVLQCIVVPEDHYVDAVNFKSVVRDPHMEGAQFALVDQIMSYDSNGNVVLVENTDFDDAVQAATATGTNAFAIDKPFNLFLGKACLYSEPSLPGPTEASASVSPKIHILGVKILSMPTNTNFKLYDLDGGLYLTARITGFDCPSYL